MCELYVFGCFVLFYLYCVIGVIVANKFLAIPSCQFVALFYFIAIKTYRTMGLTISPLSFNIYLCRLKAGSFDLCVLAFLMYNFWPCHDNPQETHTHTHQFSVTTNPTIIVLMVSHFVLHVTFTIA